MKIRCVNCRSLFRIEEFGVATKPFAVNKVVTRCSLCCDVAAYVPHDVPRTESEKDYLRVIMLHDHLWPRAGLNCARGQKEPDDTLHCSGCQVAGAIDEEYCRRAHQYHELLLKQHREPEPDPDQDPAASKVATDYYVHGVDDDDEDD